MTEILSPRAKIFTNNGKLKTVATSLCSEGKGSKLLNIQEIFLGSFRFLQMGPRLIQEAWELSSSSKGGTGYKFKLRWPVPLSSDHISKFCIFQSLGFPVYRVRMVILTSRSWVG